MFCNAGTTPDVYLTLELVINGYTRKRFCKQALQALLTSPLKVLSVETGGVNYGFVAGSMGNSAKKLNTTVVMSGCLVICMFPA